MRESAGERRGSLDSRERVLADVVTERETKDTTDLVSGHTLLNLKNGGVHMAVGRIVEEREESIDEDGIVR